MRGMCLGEVDSPVVCCWVYMEVLQGIFEKLDGK